LKWFASESREERKVRFLWDEKKRDRRLQNFVSIWPRGAAKFVHWLFEIRARQPKKFIFSINYHTPRASDKKFSLSLLKPGKGETSSTCARCRGVALAPAPVCPVRSGGTSQNLFVQKENDMTFRPLHDRILVRRIKAEEKTSGGIIIPDTAKEKPQEGEVVAIGPGTRDDAGRLVGLDVKVGDCVLFGKWSGTEIKLDGEDLLIMKESDVLGVIESAASAKKAA